MNVEKKIQLSVVFLNAEDTPEKPKWGANGERIFYDVPIARSGLFKYKGFQVGRLDPADIEREITVYRPREVFTEEFVQSFANATLTNEHPRQTVDPNTYKDSVVGTLGDVVYTKEGIDPEFGKVLIMYAGKLIISDGTTLDEIESGKKRELSICAFANYEWIAGVTDDGFAYEGLEIPLKGNHVAVTKEGKAGGLYALNSNNEEDEMTKTVVLKNDKVTAELEAVSPTEKETKSTALKNADGSDMSVEQMLNSLHEKIDTMAGCLAKMMPAENADQDAYDKANKGDTGAEMENSDIEDVDNKKVSEKIENGVEAGMEGKEKTASMPEYEIKNSANAANFGAGLNALIASSNARKSVVKNSKDTSKAASFNDALQSLDSL